MNVLLDTCALLALARGELSADGAAALKAAREAVVSTVSLWEVSIKVASRKIRLRESPRSWFLGLCERYDLREIPIDADTACAAAALPPVHRDPFDRVLVALARARDLTILTSDDNIRRYPGVTTRW